MKYKVNNPKVSSFSLTGPRNWRRRRRWPRKRNRRRFWGIRDNDGGGDYLGKTTESAAWRWQVWVIGDNGGGVGREIWALVLNNDDGSVNGGRRRDNAPERTFLTVEATVCLQAQVIDDDVGGVGRGRQARGLSNDNQGIGGGRGINNVSEWSETTTEVAWDWRSSLGIYDDDGGVGGGIWAQRQQQQQQRRRRRIDDASKESDTTTEAAVSQWRDRCINNNNGVSILFAIISPSVTLSRFCLVDVSFWYFFHRITLFFVHWKRYYQYWNHAENIFVTSVH